MTYQVYEQFANSNSLIQCFVGSKYLSSESRRVLIWKKPRLAKFISIYACAGGGGGGQGSGGSAGALISGGGGGGSGSSIYWFFPAICIPDVLYISAGHGGLGSTGTGQTGGNTLVSLDDKIYTNYSSHLIYCSPGTGGLSDGTGGSGGAAAIAYMSVHGIGIRSFNSGFQGSSGSTANSSVNFITRTFAGVGHGYSIFCGPGAGGGNIGTPALDTPYDGGNIVLGNYIGNRLGSLANSAAKGDDGFNFDMDLSIGIPRSRGKNVPLFFTGGAGGGAGYTSSAGAGGNGSYGSGGGGSGAYLTGGGRVAANAGSGGPGLVIIISTL